MREEFEINPSNEILDCEWKTWQNIPFEERGLLPSSAGIYVVVDANNLVWYVGQSVDIRKRWFGKNHHRYPQLIRANRRLRYKIYWQSCPINQLNEKEIFYINLFKPELNYGKVKAYLPKPKAVNYEINRLFKVLNNPTIIFPIIRSVLIGEYNNEEGIQCILTIISLNDYNLLYKSTAKAYSPDVRNAWIEIETYCGKDETQYDGYWMLAYNNLDGKRFEFIADVRFLVYLEENPNLRTQFIDTIAMENIQVKALKDLSILDNLPLEEEFSFIGRNGKKYLQGIAYINYRKHLLSPIVPK